MIECPICHVMNEDQAHFCSECGQRFAPAAAAQPAFPASGPSAPEPVFPSFPPADQSQQQIFQQPQAVQGYQQPGFGNPQQQQNFGNQQSGFGNQPSGSGFGNQSSSGFGSPNSAPGFGNPNDPPGYNSPSPADLLNNPMGTPSASQTFTPSPQSEPAASYDAHRPNPTMEPPSFNAVQPSDNNPINPAPEPNSQPAPSRPKLHSPIFDGPDEPERPAPPKGMFGGGKPKGLRSPMLGEDDSEAEPPKPRGGGLRSPLLRGEDDPDHPQRGKGSQRGSLLGGSHDDDHTSSSKPSKSHLRSPLLGASDDEDEFVPQPKAPKVPNKLPQRTGGAHLRSPLLGGVDDFEGEDDDDLPVAPHKSAFPHVKRPAAKADSHDDSRDQASSGRMPGKGLRSPLLGESGGDENPAPRGGKLAGGRPKLHSPIMDGPGSQNFEAEYDEPYYEEIDDPNVLRSPLLAARSKHFDPPAAPQAKAPAANNATPPAQPPAKFPSTNSFAEPSAPSSQADFRDRGFPAPQPPADMWRDRGFSEAPNAPDLAPAQPQSKIRPAPSVPSMPSPPEVAPSMKEVSPSANARRSSRSGLLGGGSEDFDEQPINNFRNASTSPAKPAMILIVPGVIACLAKLWYMGIMGTALMGSLPFLADQVMQLVVIIALIIFGMTAGKR